MSQALATSKPMLLAIMADKYSLNEDEFSRTVRAMCGLGTATPEQVAAFLIVCKTYDLNPLTREIYAFPSKTSAGIVPIVSIDGWVNLVNSHAQCDGFEFDENHDETGELISTTCTIHRKDRKIPVSVTEYYEECKRGTDPWKMKHRMLRHKSMIQCARYAFGFAGIYDEDEGRVIADNGQMADITPKATVPSISVIEGKSSIITTDDKKASATIVHDDTEKVIASDWAPPAAPCVIEMAKGETLRAWGERWLLAFGSSKTVLESQAWDKLNSKVIDEIYASDKSLWDDWMLPETEKLIVTISAREKAAAERPKDDRITSGPITDKPADDTPADPSGGKTKTRATRKKGAKPDPNEAPDVTKDYDGFIAWAKARIAEATADTLEIFWNDQIEPRRGDMIPPDVDDLLSDYRKAEQRLGG